MRVSNYGSYLGLTDESNAQPKQENVSPDDGLVEVVPEGVHRSQLNEHELYNPDSQSYLLLSKKSEVSKKIIFLNEKKYFFLEVISLVNIKDGIE